MTQQNFLNELKTLAKSYVSPQLESVKTALRNQAKEGRNSCTIDKNEIDEYTMKYLHKEGLTVKESWSGTREEGKTIVEITWV